MVRLALERGRFGRAVESREANWRQGGQLERGCITQARGDEGLDQVVMIDEHDNHQGIVYPTQH